ncbi:putative RNA recognition motif domain, nucleotide-binding alpha-beta plait domain superfamily [Helianthus anomalus]
MSGRDKFKQDTWYDVPFKKDMGNRHQHNEKEKDPWVKFFVSNLPQGCASADLVRVFKEYGDVQGTYIARKYDRLGKRFGFVTFGKCRNMDDLESSLKDVWIGSYKLFIVPARFVDGKQIPRKEEKVWQPVKGDGRKEEFPEVVSDKNTAPAENIMQEIIADNNIVAFGEWFDPGIIAHLKSLQALTSLRSWLKNIGHDVVAIKYVGCLCVVLLFDNRDTKSDFTSNKDAWGAYVNSIEEWYGQTFKIHGVPLSLSCSKVFDDVASRFGEVIQPAMFPEEDGDLSIACVGILRSEIDRVNQKVKLKWKSYSFDVTPQPMAETSG